MLALYSQVGTGAVATQRRSKRLHFIWYVTEFLSKSLLSAEITAKAETGVQRSLAGLAQYPG